MKNLLTIALVLASANAFASRASNAALGNSIHLIDGFSPEAVASEGEFLKIETGKTTVTTAAGQNSLNAEGQLVKAMGPGNLSLTLGHLDSTIFATRSLTNAAFTSMKGQQNPLELTYGMKMDGMNVGAGLIYSNYEAKEAAPLKEKESSMGLKLGVSAGAFMGRLKVIFTDKYEDVTGSKEYKGKTAFDLTGAMNFGTAAVIANFAQSGAKVTSAGSDVADADITAITVKAVETIKSEGNDFFYGAGLTTSTTKEKLADVKSSTLTLPLIIGLEANATSWMKLRASVTQDVLLSNEKTEDATTPTNNTETNPGLNTTKFAAGAGLVYNKVTIDGTLMNDVTQQKVDGSNLLATVGLTYKF